ncbi:hypothetical protein F183_A01770 [Bryobacterales bacterium F-183]|nr:hypothetical protein F183_A01770 [Bryobacterales bacterium F-183]
MNSKKLVAVSLPAAAAAMAADLNVSLEIPKMNVAEYHRPYVAMWIEKPDQSFVQNVAVWYDVRPKGRKSGTTWLKDLRQWWRKSGRELTMPVDGVSGATRAAGSHTLSFAGAKTLAPGSYEFVIEAAREVGGRELLRVPFEWPAKRGGNNSQSAQGTTELGAVKVTVTP